MQEKEGLVDYYSHIYDGPVSTDPVNALLVARLAALILHSEQSDLPLTLTFTGS